MTGDESGGTAATDDENESADAWDAAEIVPDPVESLYLARADDVNRLRPLMAGDVFAATRLPWLEDDDAPEGLALLVSHPCAMRASGGKLVDRVRVCPIKDTPNVSRRKWTRTHRECMPLPLLVPSEARGWAGHINLAGPITTTALDLDRRIACLSEHVGLLALTQRIVLSDARVLLPRQRISEQLAGVVAEAELLEEWNDHRVPPRVASGDVLSAALEAEAATFDELLADELTPGVELRKALADPGSQAAARRLIRTAMRA